MIAPSAQTCRAAAQSFYPTNMSAVVARMSITIPESSKIVRADHRPLIAFMYAFGMTEQYLVFLLVAVLLGFLLGRLSAPRGSSGLADMDRKLTMLTEHFKLKWDPTAGVPEGVIAQVRAGNKIEAVKLYREATGKGLKESYERIEEIDKRIRFRV